MRVLILLIAAGMLASGADPGNQVAVLLSPVTNVGGLPEARIHISNSGPLGGGALDLTFNVGSFTKLGVVLSPIFVAPNPIGDPTGIADCATPCSKSLEREQGQQTMWFAFYNGSNVRTSEWSKLGSSYDHGVNGDPCNGPNTLPQVEAPLVTTSPLPMPIVVVGQDCYMAPAHRVALDSDHATTSLKGYARINNPGYLSMVRAGGKISVRYNSGTWITLTSSNTTFLGEDRFPGSFGSLVDTVDLTWDIPDGTVGVSDTSIDVQYRFNGTEFNTSGFRVLAEGILEASKTCTQIAVTLAPSTPVATATCTASNYAFGYTVLVWNAPGMRDRFRGLRFVSGGTANAFAFTPCTSSDCVPANGTYIGLGTRIPTAYSSSMLVAAPITVARSIISIAAYTDDAMPSAPPAGGDAMIGYNLAHFGNEAGTANASTLVDSGNKLTNYRLSVYTNCSSCHTTDLSDLSLFNYDNYAIMVRSMKHGLTRAQGDHIAAYVRSNAIPVSTRARIWGPVFQPGPAASTHTWNRGNTLTSIVNSGNEATANLTVDPGISAGFVIVVGNATDTDLNKYARVTSVNTGCSNCFKFATTNVSDGTYNSSTLLISDTVEAWAGAGLGQQLNSGYDLPEYMGSASDREWTGLLDARKVPIPIQFATIRQWWPTCMPQDCLPEIGYIGSAAQLRLADVAANLTPNNYSSFQAFQYGDIYNRDDQYLDYTRLKAGFGQTSVANGPVVNFYATGPYSHWAMNDYNCQLLATIKGFEVAVEKSTFHFSGQRAKSLHGGSDIPNPIWPRSNGVTTPHQFFSTGLHRIGLEGGVHNINNIAGTGDSSFYLSSANWYHFQVVIDGGNGWGQGAIIDEAYYNAFQQDYTKFIRPAGMFSWLFAPTFAVQASSLHPDVGFHNSSDNNGIDSTSMMTGQFTQSDSPAYWMDTHAHFVDAFNMYLHAVKVFYVDSGRANSYWATVFHNWTPDETAGSAFTAAGGVRGVGNAGARFAHLITLANTFSSDATDSAALLAWLKSMAGVGEFFAGHDFDADVAAGAAGDADSGEAGDLSVAAPNSPGNLITFNGAAGCPSGLGTNRYLVTATLDAANGIDPEYLVGTGPANCTTGTVGGTMAFYTTRAHLGTPIIITGCSKTRYPYPTFANGLVVPWYNCSNMN